MLPIGQKGQGRRQGDWSPGLSLCGKSENHGGDTAIVRDQRKGRRNTLASPYQREGPGMDFNNKQALALKK